MSTVITPLDPFIRQRASFFEAGQAVMHLSLGRNNYEYIEIEPDSHPDFRSRHGYHHPEGMLFEHPVSFSHAIGDGLCLASGWCAEALHDAISQDCHGHGDYWSDGSLDWNSFFDHMDDDEMEEPRQVRKVLDHAARMVGRSDATHEMLCEWQNVCEALISKPRITGAIKRMAKKLDRDGVLFDFIDYFPGRMAEVAVKRLGRMWIKRYVSSVDLRQQLLASC